MQLLRKRIRESEEFPEITPREGVKKPMLAAREIVKKPMLTAKTMENLTPEEDKRWRKQEMLQLLQAGLGEANSLGVRLCNGFQMYPYQISTVQFSIDIERGANFNPQFPDKGSIWWVDMGLGKTLMAGALILARKAPKETLKGTLMETPKETPKETLPTLFITEFGLLYSSLREFCKFFGTQLRILVYHKKPIDASEFQDYDLVFTTYSKLLSSKCELHKQKWERVILDESHTIRNPQIKIFQRLCTLDAKYRLCMTGTPLHNRLDDFFAQLYFIGLRLPPLLKKTEFVMKQYNVMQYVRIVRREDVQEIALPEKFIHRITFELSPEERFLHDYFHRDSSRPDMFVRATQVCTAPYLLTMASKLCISEAKDVVFEDPKLNNWIRNPNGPAGVFSSKMKQLHSLLREIECKGEKMLVFANFSSTLKLAIESLETKCPGFSNSIAFLHGQVKHRENVLARFRRDPSCRMLFMTLKIGGQGLNLPEASIVIFLEHWFSDSAHEQAISRVYRLGQTKEVHVYYLTATNSIEEQTFVLAQSKREMTESLHNQESEFSDE